MNERYTKEDGTPIIMNGNGTEIPFVQTYLNYQYNCLMDRDFHNMEELIDLIAPYFLNVNHETSCIVNFNNDMHPINIMLLGMGDYTAVPTPISIALQGSLLSNAQGAIYIHNHPTMNGTRKLEPSAEDIMLTGQLIKAYDAIGLKLYDSIIISWESENGEKKPKWYSMHKHKKFYFPLSNAAYFKDKKALGLGLSKKSKEYYGSIRNKATIVLEKHLNFEQPSKECSSNKEYIEGLTESKKHNCAISVINDLNNMHETLQDFASQLDFLNKNIK